jgi:hypothetical protein
MRGDVHHDDRLFTLFWLRRGCCGSGLRFRRRLRLWSGDRLRRRLLYLNRLLRLNGLLTADCCGCTGC